MAKRIKTKADEYGIKIAETTQCYKYLQESTIVTESGLKSEVDPNFRPKGKKTLSSFKKVKITKELCKRYGDKYKYLRHLRVDNNTEGYFFMDKNNIVSTIVVETKENGQKWIQALEINKDYQGYGLGKETLKFAINSLHAKYLSVFKDNNVAIKMYEDMGFVKYDKTDYMFFMRLK